VAVPKQGEVETTVPYQTVMSAEELLHEMVIRSLLICLFYLYLSINISLEVETVVPYQTVMSAEELLHEMVIITLYIYVGFTLSTRW